MAGVGRLRDVIYRILDHIDPPRPKAVMAPCPACGRDVSAQNVKSAVKNDLTFFHCVCGHASAWHWNGKGPQLIYGQEPADDPEIYEDLE
jgi:hypothetical protein